MIWAPMTMLTICFFNQILIIKASYENSHKSVGWTADIEDVSKLIITVLSKIYKC